MENIFSHFSRRHIVYFIIAKHKKKKNSESLYYHNDTVHGNYAQIQ
jgi:hypothetical protein